MTTGAIRLEPEQEPPRVPMDFSWAKQMGLIRKPAEFVTSISDERGEEVVYGGMPLSKTFEVRRALEVVWEEGSIVQEGGRHGRRVRRRILYRSVCHRITPGPVVLCAQEDIGVGGVVSLLWFKRRLPVYATKFIEMVSHASRTITSLR